MKMLLGFARIALRESCVIFGTFYYKFATRKTTTYFLLFLDFGVGKNGNVDCMIAKSNSVLSMSII